MNKISIDTNAFRFIFEGRNRTLLDLVEQAETVFVSVIAIGELISGFKRGKREIENRGLLERFLTKSTIKVIDVTIETAQIYAELKKSLDKAGTPIPTNDVWIAAHGMETGSVLVTFDKHFLKIPGLRTWHKFELKN